MKPVIIVQGGQYGSESKGAVCAHICRHENVDMAVRTGATNAGHTVEFNGKMYVNQQLPVAWVVPDITLVLGAGSIIDIDILNREVDMINAAYAELAASYGGGSYPDVRTRIFIDHRAYIHRSVHAERSKDVNRHHAIGATGKGCSEAVMDRVRLRGFENWTVYPHRILFNQYQIVDTERMINDAIDNDKRVMLEGTQGTLLDMMLGPYPYVTHKQTTAANWMSEAGISPSVPTDIVMVVRAMPIRVAGNSGPLPREMSWPQLAKRINLIRNTSGLPPIVEPRAVNAFEIAVHAAAQEFGLPPELRGDNQHRWASVDRRTFNGPLSEINKNALNSLDAATIDELRKLFEFTTVTKKLRRIAEVDRDELRVAARQVRPTRVALTFLNYVFPERWGGNEPLSFAECVWVNENIAIPCRAPVFWVNRGPRIGDTVLPDQTIAGVR